MANSKIKPKMGGKFRLLAKIFANPDLPEIDDYYEPFTYDYEHLQKAPASRTTPTARMQSAITGERMEKPLWGPNWEEILGGEFSKRSKDYNFEDIEKEIYGQFENTFMMYLPRLCEHCLNPTCVASCPSGAIYKREEDGIVLIDQDKCRGWRMCVSGCPYKKIYFNWQSGKSEKCTFCYPRIEAGDPTVCSETCVGRIRYLGVLLYDADRIAEAASVTDKKDLYQAQLDIFLDPHDPEVISAGQAGWCAGQLDRRQRRNRRFTRWPWIGRWHFRCTRNTAPCRWSGISRRCHRYRMPRRRAKFASDGVIPDVTRLRIPVKYLANLLTAGKEEPVVAGLERMIAMRAYMRARTVDGVNATEILDRVGLDEKTLDDMYQIMAHSQL